MVSFQIVADPCASNPCHHGNCSSSGSGYLCACTHGYEGPNCEQALPSLPASGWTEAMPPRQLQPVPATREPDSVLPGSQATMTLPTWQPKSGQKVVEMKWDQVEVRMLVACVFMEGISQGKIIPAISSNVGNKNGKPVSSPGEPSDLIPICTCLGNLSW